MNKQYLYVYLDETKNMSLNEACFGGIVTTHRLSYIEKIYAQFLKEHNLWDKNKEVKSYDKHIEHSLDVFQNYIYRHSTDVLFFWVYVKNYKDHIDKYLQIIQHITKEIQKKYDQAIIIFADKVRLGEKKSLIKNYIYNTTWKRIEFYYENSKSNSGLQCADLFCGLLKKKFLYTFNQKDLIHQESLAFPLQEIFLK